MSGHAKTVSFRNDYVTENVFHATTYALREAPDGLCFMFGQTTPWKGVVGRAVVVHYLGVGAHFLLTNRESILAASEIHATADPMPDVSLHPGPFDVYVANVAAFGLHHVGSTIGFSLLPPWRVLTDVAGDVVETDPLIGVVLPSRVGARMFIDLLPMAERLVTRFPQSSR